MKNLLINWTACNELFAPFIALDTWWSQLNFESKVIPRTLISFFALIKTLSHVKWPLVSWLWWKTVSSVLFSLTLSLDSFNHFTIFSSYLSRSSSAAFLFLAAKAVLKTASPPQWVKSKKFVPTIKMYIFCHSRKF